MSLLKFSIYLSMLIQIITGIIGFRSLYFVIPDRHQILKTINKLELGVQIVEFCFYIWISIAVMALSGMTSRRYIDWFITTPTMLLTTVLFFNYNLHLDEENKKGLNETEKTTLTFWDIIKNVKWNYALIFILNAGMLLFGLLGELKIIPLVLSNILGFMCFALLFKELYSFVGDNDENKYIFVYFLIVWGLYGIAQLFSDLNKNISYNFLDVIAKNFYGLFIYYKLSTLAI